MIFHHGTVFWKCIKNKIPTLVIDNFDDIYSRITFVIRKISSTILGKCLDETQNRVKFVESQDFGLIKS